MKGSSSESVFVEHPADVDNVTCYCFLESPVGRLLLTSDGESLTGLFPAALYAPRAPLGHWVADERFFVGVADQLGAYFQGRLKRFEVPLAPTGTPFQQQAWTFLSEVPFGQPLSLAALAARLQRSAVAVRTAIFRNPLSILVPTHRVDLGGAGQTVSPAFERWLARLTAHEGGTPLEIAPAFSLIHEGFGLRTGITRST